MTTTRNRDRTMDKLTKAARDRVATVRRADAAGPGISPVVTKLSDPSAWLDSTDEALAGFREEVERKDGHAAAWKHAEHLVTALYFVLDALPAEEGES
jgi:hypothetical protein